MPHADIHVFAPASVANVACGFDTLGFAIQRPGDDVVVRLARRRGVRIAAITGVARGLPVDPRRNTAGVAVLALLKHLGEEQRGIELRLRKGIPAGSGLGSSACSAVAAVVAVNELLGRPLPRRGLLPFALAGEAIASGGAIHADNVGPALLGGMVLVRSNDDLDLINIPIPPELHVAVVLPRLTILTAQARAVLPAAVPLRDAVAQWGNVGGLIAGFMAADYGLIGRSLHDRVAEPARAHLIPHLRAVQEAARQTGALGCSIAGSGPACFALCRGDAVAFEVAIAMQRVFTTHGIPCERYISPINLHGAMRIR
jgi:homoserine kinase